MQRTIFIVTQRMAAFVSNRQLACRLDAMILAISPKWAARRMEWRRVASQLVDKNRPSPDGQFTSLTVQSIPSLWSPEMDRITARNNLQHILGLPRERANWLADVATEEEIASLSGSATPAESLVRQVAGAALDRIRASIAPQA